jgi:L-fuconolactonase
MKMLPFPVVDTHVHFIDLDRHSYPEIAQAPPIHKTHLPGDFDRLRGGVEVDKIVFLDVAVADEDQVEEAKFAAELAESDPRIQAIVPAAQIELGAEVEDQLEELNQLPLVRGIRRLIQNKPDPDFCARPGFIEGVRRLARHGLHFEICIYHNQLGAALELARQCPDVPLLLDHIGKPCIRHDLVEPWWSQIHAMAALPHVHCKVSGVITEDDHERWTEGHIRPYLDRIFDVFGIERVMFGSDWPVSELTHRYADWVGILDRFTSACSDDERRRFFRQNAIEFYRLN